MPTDESWVILGSHDCSDDFIDPLHRILKKKDNIEQRVHSFFREFVISERPEQQRDRDLLSRS